MALRHRHISLLIGLALATLACAFAMAATSQAQAQAKASACERWGKSAPADLTTGQARKAILCLINEKRRSAGLPALDRDKKLQKAAQRHNARMDGSGCFDHECPGEPGLDSRLEAVNYLVGGLLRWAFGENIAWGMGELGTPRAIVGAWMNSSGHRANILNRDFREIGIGFSQGTPSASRAAGGIYTTDFGLRAD
jgi:uncharacterized protein YkwD